jgi:hypothetical protein
MIKKIWNWIKNIFKSEKQDPHLVLYEEVEHTHKNGITHSHKGGSVPHEHLEHCVKHLRFKKSCPDCREVVA